MIIIMLCYHSSFIIYLYLICLIFLPYCQFLPHWRCFHNIDTSSSPTSPAADLLQKILHPRPQAGSFQVMMTVFSLNYTYNISIDPLGWHWILKVGPLPTFLLKKKLEHFSKNLPLWDEIQFSCVRKQIKFPQIQVLLYWTHNSTSSVDSILLTDIFQTQFSNTFHQIHSSSNTVAINIHTYNIQCRLQDVQTSSKLFQCQFISVHTIAWELQLIYQMHNGWIDSFEHCSLCFWPLW